LQFNASPIYAIALHDNSTPCLLQVYSLAVQTLQFLSRAERNRSWLFLSIAKFVNSFAALVYSMPTLSLTEQFVAVA
jgi:hypothetical protein